MVVTTGVHQGNNTFKLKQKSSLFDLIFGEIENFLNDPSGIRTPDTLLKSCELKNSKNIVIAIKTKT